jgi:hypothetical protein
MVSIRLTEDLQLVQNDLSRTELLLDASTYLAAILALYASIEMHYSDVGFEDCVQLQDSIVTVYTAVLRYAFRGEESSGQWDLPFVPALSFVVLSHKLTKQQTGS